MSVTDNSSFNFDVCLENSGSDLNNCESNSGNPALSLAVGDIDTFFLTLSFLSTADGVTLPDFAARLQGINPNDSAKVFGEPVSTPDDPNVAPEPSTVLLVGTGALVAGARRRFRRSA